MHGVYVNGRRPKSKKEIKDAVKAINERLETEKLPPLSTGRVMASNKATARVSLEGTSMFGNEFGGNVLDMKVGQKVTFVGPDPQTKRSFYGVITRTEKGFKVS